MKNYNNKLLALVVVSLAGCGSGGSGESPTPSNNNHGNQNSDMGTGKDEPVITPIIIGVICDWSVDFHLRCQDNSVVSCDPLTDHWTAEACGTKICVEDKNGNLAEEAACYKTCDPANYREQHDCEDPDVIGTNPIGTTYSCQKVADNQYAVLISQKYCSECDGKECIIDEEDFGRNAQPGDGCNTFLFTPRCENGAAINCEQQTEHISETVNMVYGTVIKRQCQNGCQIIPSYDRLTMAVCNEDDISADYYCSVHQDGDFCSIRECFVDHATSEAKTVCTWELYPLNSDNCSQEAIDYWHTGYNCK